MGAAGVERVYLDWNASAPVLPAAYDAAVDALGRSANASSVHAEGRDARIIVETVRRRLASRFGIAPERVTFTSGGTEANATALMPGVPTPAGEPAERLIVSAVEHPATLSGGRFPLDKVETIPVDDNGVVDLAALESALAGPPALVSIMAANNETGVRQPLEAIHAVVKQAGGIFHTDAVQAFGRVPDTELYGDLISLSGHKIGAPPGVGALLRLSDVPVTPLLRGGGQERGTRGGTENVPAIAGFGAALDAAPADPAAWADTAAARTDFEERIVRDYGAVIFGANALRLPNTTLLAVPGPPAELALIALDLAGVAVSSGSACSSGKVSASHVLSAMGVPTERAQRAIRVSTGPQNASEAYLRFCLALEKAVVRLSA